MCGCLCGGPHRQARDGLGRHSGGVFAPHRLIKKWEETGRRAGAKATDAVGRGNLHRYMSTARRQGCMGADSGGSLGDKQSGDGYCGCRGLRAEPHRLAQQSMAPRRPPGRPNSDWLPSLFPKTSGWLRLRLPVPILCCATWLDVFWLTIGRYVPRAHVVLFFCVPLLRIQHDACK